MNRVRLLTFNIHGGRGRDGIRNPVRVHALMERLQVDIGVFQEMETRTSCGGSTDDAALLAGASRPYRFAGPSMTEGSGWYGNLMVSRYPVARATIHDLETGKNLEPRNAIDALIDTPLGTLRVIGTHLSLRPAARWLEAQNLIRLVAAIGQQEKCPVFLMGDINEWRWPSRLLRFLDGVMTSAPCKGTFPAWLPLFKLDRVWYDAPAFQVAVHRLSGQGIGHLSDHLPLLIDVTRRTEAN